MVSLPNAVLITFKLTFGTSQTVPLLKARFDLQVTSAKILQRSGCTVHFEDLHQSLFTKGTEIKDRKMFKY